MAFTNILLIGATGNLGSLILKHLIASPADYKVTVLTRESSSSAATTKDAFPSSVTVRKISSDYPDAELVEAFRGQDVVIGAISMTGMHLQYRIIDAAVAAGVKRYFPTEFGLDELPDWLVELRPMFRIKHDVRDYLVTKEKEGLQWTCIVCNVFFEMGIMSGFFNFHWGVGEGGKKNKAVLVDGGDVKWVATTLETVAVAVVRSIERADKTKNKLLLIQDFRTSQRELLDRIQLKTGADAWTVEDVKYDEWLEEAKETVRGGDNSALGRLTFGTVLLGSNWEERAEYGNTLLDLPTRSFEDAIQSVLKDVS
ncbi:uncharacterized protein A1O9_04926 [Exophiala aquamarina CBS 119918]|uniref:NmrA-like domain-containing protein n=1 Tax=Exophiala aquamarina CBS 119918 TaxID=1182545 RepID=A0A072PJK5_9EURO|nr:uncharacterized protein A1O9_04926 [Exophiala aquamarina CBS 119918]KEF60076.1 hypothetical protein A1O9_04926 [Exophiala aquamarina CBS 119918]